MSDEEIRLKCLELALAHGKNYYGGLEIADISKLTLEFEKIISSKT
jgi:hypothetical protein